MRYSISASTISINAPSTQRTQFQHFEDSTPPIPSQTTCSVERRRPLRSKHLLVRLWGVAVRQRELEVLGEQLLDVRATHIIRLLDLDHLQDLQNTSVTSRHIRR